MSVEYSKKVGIIDILRIIFAFMSEDFKTFSPRLTLDYVFVCCIDWRILINFLCWRYAIIYRGEV